MVVNGRKRRVNLPMQMLRVLVIRMLFFLWYIAVGQK